MKIIYCLPQIYKPGGIERIISIKANYLADILNYDIYIITACQLGKQPYYTFSNKIKFIDLGIDYDSTLALPIWKRVIKKRSLQLIHKQKLKQILYDIRPDITISTFTHEAAFLPEIKDGSKKILEFHFCRGHKCKMANAFGFSFLTKLAYYIKCWFEENCIIPKYDKFVVLTKEDQTDWINKIPTVECIPNILPFESEKQALLNNKEVIAVGRLDAQKRFDRLIELWQDIYRKHPDWKLKIFGQGHDEQKLRTMVFSLGLDKTVEIHSPSQDIIHEYLNSSIFVMTSAYEGLPMTLLEATGLGLPTVCFDFKCGPKDVIINEENGFLIKEGNSEEFIHSVCKLIENDQLRKKIGKSAKDLSVRYSQKTIMNKWIKLFNKITESYE